MDQLDALNVLNLPCIEFHHMSGKKGHALSGKEQKKKGRSFLVRLLVGTTTFERKEEAGCERNYHRHRIGNEKKRLLFDMNSDQSMESKKEQ